jgi:hypothetical protein
MDKKQDHGKNEFYNYFDLVFYKKWYTLGLRLSENKIICPNTGGVNSSLHQNSFREKFNSDKIKFSIMQPSTMYLSSTATNL